MVQNRDHAVRIQDSGGNLSETEFPGLSRAVLFASAQTLSPGVLRVEIVRDHQVVWSSDQSPSPEEG